MLSMDKESSIGWIIAICGISYTILCLLYVTIYYTNKNSKQYVLVDSIDDNNSNNNYKLPRTYLWLQQLTLIGCMFFITMSTILKIYFCNEYQDDVVIVLTKEFYVVVILICQLIALLNDFNRYNMTLALKIIWLPVYIMALIYSLIRLTLFLISMSNNTLIMSLNIVAVIFATLTLYFALYRLFITNSTSPVKQVHPPPYEYTCSLYQYLTFSFINNDLIAKISMKDSLELDDIPTLGDNDRSDYLYRLLNMANSNKEITNWFLIYKVYSVSKSIFWLQQFFQVFGSLLCYVPAITLRVVLNYVSSSTNHDNEYIWLVVFLAFASPFMKSLIDGQTYWLGRRLAVQSRSCLLVLLYDKVLNIDINNLSDHGMISTCISTDITEVSEFLGYFQFIWCSLLEVMICACLLYIVLGEASLFGVAVMILITVPLGNASQKYLKYYSEKRKKEKDKRMNVVGEMLTGVRIIKWFTWEEDFLSKIANIRSIEIGHLKNFIYTDMIQRTLLSLLPAIVGLVSFVVHTQLLHRTLNPSVGFTSLFLFANMRLPLKMLSQRLTAYSRAFPSLVRIVQLLNSKNIVGLDSYTMKKVTSNNSVIDFTNVTLMYPKPKNDTEKTVKASKEISTMNSICQTCRNSLCFHSSNIDNNKKDIEEGIELNPLIISADVNMDNCVVVLKELNFQIPSGALVVITGPTGSGKSTLLLGMLGECHKVKGDISINDDYLPTSKCTNDVKLCGLSYVSQNAWIQNATIRDNILMGNIYDEFRYNTVLMACGLDIDVRNMTYGDKTEIGERGINLSGGQQQRISLARAAYSYSKIILMDDPLSAVDAHTGDHIFKHLICDFLSDRTRILVTHAIALVANKADYLIKLNHQHEFYIGPPLLESSENVFVDDSDSANKNPKLKASTTDKDTSKFIENEFKAKGNVKWNVYWFYLTACGGVISASLLLLVDVSVPLAQFLQNYALGEWINDVEHDSTTKKRHVGIEHYVLCVLFVTLCFILKFTIQSVFALRAAYKLHNDMTKCMILANTDWHDKQPLGRKINRFSQDAEAVDCDVMQRTQDFLDSLINSTQIIFVIVIMIPIQLLFLTPILLYIKYFSEKYINVSRDLKRLESVNKSPVFVHFSETVSGLSIIRAYRKQGKFYDIICHYIDQMNRCHLYNWAANRWLNIRAQVMGALVSGAVSLFIVVERDNISSTLAGIILLYSLQFTDSMVNTLRCYAECQNSMNSVERVQEYCNLESEKYLNKSLGNGIYGNNNNNNNNNNNRQQMIDDTNWPQQGNIRFDKLCLKYRLNEPAVLKDITFDIDSGMKVGIVGRSGAGKSSILTALFRTTEPCSGKIIIDGIDILTLPLQDVRNILAIVPQDPILFRGSIKSNLDPFDKYTDEDMWNVLKKCKLSSHIANMDGGMKGQECGPLHDKIITERGSNLSVGQRQLLCLCRAMIRKSKILILDEATASVDIETDACLQDTIRNEFDNITIISIAHRLKTVAFYDKIVVMDDGRVCEYDTPQYLLNNVNSRFYKLAEDSGELQQLKEIANSQRTNQASS